MNDDNFTRVERYCEIIDHIKELKLLVKTKKQLKILGLVENVFNGLMAKERIV